MLREPPPLGADQAFQRSWVFQGEGHTLELPGTFIRRFTSSQGRNPWLESEQPGVCGPVGKRAYRRAAPISDLGFIGPLLLVRGESETCGTNLELLQDILFQKSIQRLVQTIGLSNCRNYCFVLRSAGDRVPPGPDSLRDCMQMDRSQ